MKLKTLIIVLVLAAIGLFAGAPYYTAHQIKQAVQSNDVHALAGRVDFERVRASLKRQMADAVASKMPESAQGNVVIELGGMLASRAADAALKTLITPEGLADLLSGRMAAPPFGPAQETDAGDSTPPRMSARYASWDRFRIDLPAKKHSVGLILTREGVLSWKLTDIDLSDLLKS